MGVFNFLMRQMSKSPAIVETTKTVVRQYRYFVNKHPKLDKKEIYRKIIEQRYELVPLNDENKYKGILDEVSDMSNLRDLIFNILWTETDLRQTGNTGITNTLRAISEVLRELGEGK